MTHKSIFEDIEDVEAIPADEQNFNPDNDNYEFITGDLQNFEEEFQEPKEDMSVDMRPTDEEFEMVEKPSIPKKVARGTGRFITHIIDTGASRTLAMFSGKSPEQHKADPDELKELEEIITLMVQETGGEIPLWAQLALAIGTTYGTQIWPAYIQFKQNKK